MSIHKLMENIKNRHHHEAVIYENRLYSYSDIHRLIKNWQEYLSNHSVMPGTVVAIICDYSPDAIALVISLILNKNIIVPLSLVYESHFSEYFEISHAQNVINISSGTNSIEKINVKPEKNKLLKKLIDNKLPGLILFTSGSTGQPKAVVHDFNKLLSKFQNAEKRFRTLCFLMFDHIAGIDTYFYTLFSGGTVILPKNRKTGYICRLIENHKVEVLPTSPTFLNLLLLSEDYKKYNLSSLKIITYGSETMPDSLLNRLQKIFPDIRFIQKYGTTEFGSPSSKSNNSNPLWIKMDSKYFKTKIIEGVLFVKSDSVMMGYLNADNPFTEDGWFNTGDLAEVDGEYLKIRGRKSDIINVGGEKVYPQEVESVIMGIDNVADVIVSGEKNPITGEIVCATIYLKKDEDPRKFTLRMKQYCNNQLEKYKIPVRVKIEHRINHTRYKKVRRGSSHGV